MNATTRVFDFVRDLPSASPFVKTQAAAAVATGVIVGATTSNIWAGVAAGAATLATVATINTPDQFQLARAQATVPDRENGPF